MAGGGRRTVLLGLGRRITLEELRLVSQSNDCIVELQESAKTEEEEKAASSYMEKYNPLTAVQEVLAKKENETTTELSLLSPEETLACLTVVSLYMCQGRMIPPTKAPSSASDSIASAVSALVELINSTKLQQQGSSGSGSSAGVQFPKNASLFVSALLPLLSNAIPNETQLHPLLFTATADGSSRVPLPYISRAISIGSGCLALADLRQLSKAVDAVAALSAERLRIDPTLHYADQRFDLWRPHRYAIASALNLRAILHASKYRSTPPQQSHDIVEYPPETLLAAQDIPQYHGPAKEHILSACKTMELEMNCTEPNADSTLDPTVASMALAAALNSAVSFLDYSRLRINSPPHNNNHQQHSPIQQLSNLQDLVQSFSNTVSQLRHALEHEIQYNRTQFTTQQDLANHQIKKKEAEKAARAQQIKKQQQDNNEDEFLGMSEEQKNKILRKRAEKEAKAAAKRAAKEKKNAAVSSDDATTTANTSIFGSGIAPILSALQPNANNTTLTDAAIAQIETILDKLLSGGIQRKPKIPKGTRDYLPDQMAVRDQAFQIIRRVFKSHGAVEIDTPVFELKDTLTGKYGEDSKLIYDLADQGGELLALRYDLTVPFARFLALNSVGNIKRFHIGKVYRRDQPALSRGRYREFYQCDFDIAGQYGRMVPDSECLCVVCDILHALPIGDFAVKLNHRRLLDAILDLCGVPSDKFRTICSAVDKLDKEPWDEVKREMVEDKGLSSDVADRIGTFVLRKGNPMELYEELKKEELFGTHQGAAEAMEDLRLLFGYLDAMGKLQYMSFDLSLARGLDYYTGVIYEAVCVSGNTQVGSIGGGGRYDNLVSMFQEAGKITPCVGVSVGIERVFTLMEAKIREEQGGTIHQVNVNVLVASIGNNMMTERMKLARILWDANISAEYSQKENPKLKHEIPYALERGIPFMVIVGEEEVKMGTCKVKDLKANEEVTVNVSDLVKTLRGKGVIPVGCEFAAEFLKMEEKQKD